MGVVLLNVGIIHRTGWKESDLVDNYDAKSRKWDLALHYRPVEGWEIAANYRNGSGSSIYQGSQKYALRDFKQNFYKLDIIFAVHGLGLENFGIGIKFPVHIQ